MDCGEERRGGAINQTSYLLSNISRISSVINRRLNIWSLRSECLKYFPFSNSSWQAGQGGAWGRGAVRVPGEHRDQAQHHQTPPGHPAPGISQAWITTNLNFLPWNWLNCHCMAWYLIYRLDMLHCGLSYLIMIITLWDTWHPDNMLQSLVQIWISYIFLG